MHEPANAPGHVPHHKLGSTWDGTATTFRLFSRHATRVQLELASGATHDLVRGDDDTWELATPGAPPGTAYGFRVHGPFDPSQGHLFNPCKRLLDPYAHRVLGATRWSPDLRGGVVMPDKSVVIDPSDSGAVAPWSVVVDDPHPVSPLAAPIPWRDTLIYECHVKGMTALHPQVSPHLRGTYLGLASPVIIEHLKSLGVTAVELLPVQPASDNALTVKNGLTNYWGYATVAFLAPDARFATAPGREITEFQAMVSAFHDAGMEVILDVAYNHSGEGGVEGCTVAFRGLDNASYYRLEPDGDYEDVTGCGNTLDVRSAPVRTLIRDSLAWWSQVMGVDGFRFDLAAALGRTGEGDTIESTFFEQLRDDPALLGTKLIAEPWDLGRGGYRLGQFPPGWSEWNGRYRDDVRRFWRGAGSRATIATRIAGSSDFFHGRTPEASINFVTCHDGFTLYDLVAYERKHNFENGEGNRDGADWNESSNFGAEGPVADPEINEARRRARRGLLATLAFSLGVPMLSHGDEMGRTQSGNNNAWCQDNALSWLPWLDTPDAKAMHAFTSAMFALRRRYGVFRRTAFLHLGDEHGVEARARWLDADGSEMTIEDWEDPEQGLLAVELRTGIGPDAHGWVLLAMNGSGSDATLVLPEPGNWIQVLDTSKWPAVGAAGPEVVVPARSVVMLEAVEATSRRPEP